MGGVSSIQFYFKMDFLIFFKTAKPLSCADTICSIRKSLPPCGTLTRCYFCDRLVTPYSKLDFRVLNHYQFKADAVLGQTTVDLNSLLHKHEGKCKCSIRGGGGKRLNNKVDSYPPL